MYQFTKDLTMKNVTVINSCIITIFPITDANLILLFINIRTFIPVISRFSLNDKKNEYSVILIQMLCFCHIGVVT